MGRPSERPLQSTFTWDVAGTTEKRQMGAIWMSFGPWDVGGTSVKRQFGIIWTSLVRQLGVRWTLVECQWTSADRPLSGI